MMPRYLLYYITDRTVLASDEPGRRRRLLEKISEAVYAGVDYIQLREKDLSTRDLESLAREAVSVVKEAGVSARTRHRPTALLINSRTDIALAAGADGVHLRSSDISPDAAKQVWKWETHRSDKAISTREPVIGVSCHSSVEVERAAAQGATLAVFAPVFEKKVLKKKISDGEAPEQTEHQGAGLGALQKACRGRIPVLALGGVTLANAGSCLEAGASGIAGIRLFQENDIRETARILRKANRVEEF